MKRKILLGLTVLLIMAALSACTVMVNDPWVEGNVYLAYYWDANFPIRNYSDNNPWMPDIVVNNTYYLVAPGYYYGQYTTYNGVIWGYDYTLTANYAYSSDPQGPASAYFQLWLSENGPYFYDWTYARSLGNNFSVTGEIAKSQAAAPQRSGKSTTVIEKTVNGYTMHLEYWKVE